MPERARFSGRREWTEGLTTHIIEKRKGWQGKEGGREGRVENERAAKEGRK